MNMAARKDRRRRRRIPYIGPLRLLWEDDTGRPKYLSVKILDISERGIRVESPEPIPENAHVSVRADRINLAGPAAIKYQMRIGSKYLLGMELSPALKNQAEELFRHPSSVEPPLLVGLVPKRQASGQSAQDGNRLGRDQSTIRLPPQ